jgi:Domain of unknown function (DUF1996)
VNRGLAAVLVLIPALAAGGAGLASPRPLHGANFWVKCYFSHFASDDPIVYPGRPGRSHSHTFFGNRSTDAFSTPAKLRHTSTTCKSEADRAAYWVPTLYLDGRPVKPASIGVYHKLKTSTEIRPFPAGLRMVAGNAAAYRPQNLHVAYWTCWMRRGPSSAVPTCPSKPLGFDGRKSYLTLHVVFPDCWDGVHLDSRDHHSHMAYSNYGACPRSHPVQVPGLQYVIEYPVLGGPGVTLSSGSQFSAHGDFMNGWDQKALAGIVARCGAVGAKTDCAEGSRSTRPRATAR